MLNMIYDILILAAKKDFDNLQSLYNSLVHLQPTYNNIYCICPEYPEVHIKGITYVLDNDVLVPSLPTIRSSWIYQQYLKLLQNITLDNYLVVDADIIFNKDIDVVTNDVPNFLISNSTINRPFFKWCKEMFDLDRSFDKSFISEVMLFDRSILNEFISDKEEFIKKSNSVITIDCFPSEYEVYGNYVHTNYKEMYNYTFIKTSPQFLFKNFNGSLEEFILLQKDSIFNILNISS